MSDPTCTPAFTYLVLRLWHTDAPANLYAVESDSLHDPPRALHLDPSTHEWVYGPGDVDRARRRARPPGLGGVREVDRPGAERATHQLGGRLPSEPELRRLMDRLHIDWLTRELDRVTGVVREVAARARVTTDQLAAVRSYAPTVVVEVTDVFMITGRGQVLVGHLVAGADLPRGLRLVDPTTGAQVVVRGIEIHRPRDAAPDHVSFVVDGDPGHEIVGGSRLVGWSG